jgi:hypothetical protein
MIEPAMGVMIKSLSDGCSGSSTKYSQNVEARTDATNEPPGPRPLPRAI